MVSHSGSGTAMVVDGGKAATAATGAKSGPFPSIRITGKAWDSTTVIQRHGGVRTVTRRAVEL